MKTRDASPITILMADDDPDDRLLTKQALEENKLQNVIRFVEDGEELVDYLCRRGKFENETDSPRPGIILLDLNMPRKDGREALREIKAHPDLKTIPVVVLTTSTNDEDITHSYDLGVNSYIAKPVSFESLVTLMRLIANYWFQVVELPRLSNGY